MRCCCATIIAAIRRLSGSITRNTTMGSSWSTARRTVKTRWHLWMFRIRSLQSKTHHPERRSRSFAMCAGTQIKASESSRLLPISGLWSMMNCGKWGGATWLAGRSMRSRAMKRTWSCFPLASQMQQRSKPMTGWRTTVSYWMLPHPEQGMNLSFWVVRRTWNGFMARVSRTIYMNW